MKPIGGYFELETNARQAYHAGLIQLNTGRNSLEYILRVRKYTKVYIPYFTCDVILEPFKKLDVNYTFYHIDKQLDPIIDFEIRENEALLYTNYFGLKESTVERLANEKLNLIVDNAQAFYDKPLNGIDTFYSSRKFFGVPDGAYVSINMTLTENFKMDVSLDRFSHLLKRMEFDSETGYGDFLQNEKDLAGQSIKQMSLITKKLLAAIDYEAISYKRKGNFISLHNKLKKKNELNFEMPSEAVPMVYPFYVTSPGLRDYLIQNKVYVATYWLNVLDWTKPEQWEHQLTKNLIPLPVDQRYGNEDMNRIIHLIEQYK